MHILQWCVSVDEFIQNTKHTNSTNYSKYNDIVKSRETEGRGGGMEELHASGEINVIGAIGVICVLAILDF